MLIHPLSLSLRVCQCVESGFPGRLKALGHGEVTEGGHGGFHACAVLEAPVAHAFPFVTQSHVRQGKENCYDRAPLHFKSVSDDFQLRPNWPRSHRWL